MTYCSFHCKSGLREQFDFDTGLNLRPVMLVEKLSFELAQLPLRRADDVGGFAFT